MKFKKQSEDDLIFDLIAIIAAITFIILFGFCIIYLTDIIANIVTNFLQGKI